MGRQLKCYFNLLALNGVKGKGLEDIAQAGYEGVQFVTDPKPGELSQCRDLGLETATSGRVNEPADVDALARKWAAAEFVCSTLHVGWGIESEQEASALIESILDASAKHGLPLYVETHRATIFQDMWRTVEFVKRFPELRFNGDFSHWYTGQEMVYGGFERKFEYITPVLERVRFLHGRIGNPGCIQVGVEVEQKPEPTYLGHFRQLWTTCFRYGADLFVPELLAPDIYYARTFPDGSGQEAEESNRWEQSLALREIAEECFRDSQSRSA